MIDAAPSAIPREFEIGPPNSRDTLTVTQLPAPGHWGLRRTEDPDTDEQTPFTDRAAARRG
ncbi:MAG: hypothetical protein ACKOF7_11525, partial [Phycisphaerales bacterium]